MRINQLFGVSLLALVATPSAVDAQVNTTVETLRVPADGSSVTAQTRLKPRKIYYIIADGRVWDNESVGLLGDAEYDNISTEPRDTCGDGVTDTGIGINTRPIYFGGTGKTNRWGPFNDANRYEAVWVIGKNDSSKVSFSYHDCVYQANNDYAPDPLTIEIRAPQSGDCTVDIAYQEPPRSEFYKDVSIALEGHLFDYDERRAHWCNNSLFNVYASIAPGLEKPLSVEVPEGVFCSPSPSESIWCYGPLRGETVKLTFGTVSPNKKFQKLRSYTVVPVDPYH